MTRTHRELYCSFLRLANLKKTKTTKNENKIFPSDQKEEIPDEARRVELLLDEYDSLWTEEGWPRARKPSELSKKTTEVEKVQTSSNSMFPTSDPYTKSRPTKIKSSRPQTDVVRTDEFLPLLTNPCDILCGQKSRDPTKCAQSATPRTATVEIFQRPAKKVLKMRNRYTMT
jgi:hypothetical protein